MGFFGWIERRRQRRRAKALELIADVEIRNLLGETARQETRFGPSAGIKLIDAAVAISNASRAMHLLALHHRADKRRAMRNAACVRDFDQLLATYSESELTARAAAYFSRAEAKRVLQGDAHASLEDYKLAIESGRDGDVYLGRAQALAALGDKNAALADLKIAKQGGLTGRDRETVEALIKSLSS